MSKPTDAQIIERLEKWFPGARKYWEPHHERFTKLKRFTKCHGENAQWDEDEVKSRSAQTPPRLTLTENLLGPFVHQLTNTLWQSDFGVKVKPKDSGTDPKLASVRQGLHRGIQQIGGFKAAINQASDDLVTGGLGAFRYITKQADPKSFRKEIKYLELDPTRLFHGDGSNRESDFCDVADSLIYEPYSKDKFRAEFDKDPEQYLGGNGMNPVWGNRGTPWVLEYFFKLEIPDTLVMYQGKEWYLSELKDELGEKAKSFGMKVEELLDFDADMKPISEPTKRCEIWWAKLAGKEVLKLEKWPGYYIPNFLATGRKVTVNGEVRYYGLGEPAVEVQKAHNYAFSALVERAGLAPKAQVYMPIEGMDPKYMNIYNSINTWNGVVPYKSKDAKGGAIDRPWKDSPIQSDPAFINLRQMTIQGIRDVLGMWETALGAQSAERSGVAIQTRERQSDTGNFDWGENLAKAAELCFKATDEMLDKVIDVPTQVRIVGEDDKEDVIWAASLRGQEGDQYGYFDLNRGKFDIYCKMAPNADTKREEQIRGMQMLFQASKEVAVVLAPEYVALQDWKGADKAAKILEQFRALQYPGLGGEVDPKVAQMQQQMQAMEAQLEALGKENQAIKADKSLEAQKVNIDGYKAESERMKIVSEAKLKSLELASDPGAVPQGEPALPGDNANQGGQPGYPMER